MKTVLEDPKTTDAGHDDGVLIRLEADYAQDGTFGRRILEVTQAAVRVREADDTCSFEIGLAELRSARHEPLVGGGRLEVTTTHGHVVPVVTYSLTEVTKFSEAARGIDQLAQGKPLAITLRTERVRCAQCRRLLPERDGICPACVNRGKTLWRIAQYLRPYRWQALRLAGLSLVGTMLNLLPPTIQGTLIDRVLSPQLELPLLWWLMGLWLVTMAAGVAVQIVSGRLVAFLAGHVAADIRGSLYRAIELLRLRYFDRKQVGAITSRVTHDTDRVWGFLVEGVPFFVTNGLLLVSVIVLLLTINWRLTLCIMAPLPAVVGISVVFWKPMSQLFHRCGQKWARLIVHLNESLSGIRVVKAFAQEEAEGAKFQERNRELRDAGVQADGRWYAIFGAMTFFTGLGALINWTVGGYMVYRQQLTLGDFWRVHAYLGLIYGPLQWFAQINNWFSRAMAGAERLFEIMDTEPEPYARAGLQPVLRGEVRFENVWFGYDKSNPVLKGLTFTAQPGELIGLVGKSGAGKSTTINLICRFYEPDVGCITVDGVDYREIALQTLRRQIGVVLQEPFLFNGTLAENIAYGRPDATFAEIVEAAKAANAHRFILQLPDRYDTLVGERGAKLSGGERQRISIARAILHDPRILILDEATSSVDVETEQQIQEALARLVAGRTTFVIAHRLSTLRTATRLIVLEEGRIVEMGTHAELMARHGVFSTLVEMHQAINQVIAA